MKHMAALELSLGAYPENWAGDYRDFWDAVDDFVDSEPHAAPHLRAVVVYILSRCQGEEELHQTLRTLGSKYYPPGDGWATNRAWLLAVADHVEKSLHTFPAA